MNFIEGLPIYNDIQEIVEDIRLELHTAGIDLLDKIKPTGNNLMVTCPNHAEGKERKPSCGISLVELKRGSRLIEAGTANCFTCGFTATLPQFISFCFGYNDAGRFGYKWLSQRYVNIEIEQRQPVLFNFDLPNNQRINYVPETELEKYRYTHPYMYERGLTDEIIDIFDIGYDQENDMITFPVNDKTGNCLFVQKRSVKGKRFDNDTGASKLTLYGLDKVWENIAWVKNVGYVVVCESPIDVATLWKWNEPAIGQMQAKATDDQIRLINELPIPIILAANDNDTAGYEGAQTLREKCNKMVKRVVFPEGKKDVNVMTKQEWLESDRTIIF